MPSHAYLFESKSIQSYVLATNRLREVVGASELIEGLTESLLHHTLCALALRADDDIRFSRRASGAFYAFGNNERVIDRLAALWSLAVRHHAPDLQFVAARASGDDDLAAFTRAHARLLHERSGIAVRFPPASPFVQRNRRTGEPACEYARSKGGGREAVDAATRRKLDLSRGGLLARRFAPGCDADAWPINLDPEPCDEETGGKPGRSRNFPFTGEDRTIAVVHADGNGLGQFFMSLRERVQSRPERFVAISHQFSLALRAAVEQAAQDATREVLQPEMRNGVFAARPIVLAGEDMTIIVRADLALAFTRCFLERFAQHSAARLTEAAAQQRLADLPGGLTACAGIAFVKASQPYYLAYELAEGLCQHAKRHARARSAQVGEVPATLSFHRVTTAVVDDYDRILEQITADRLRPTMECYAVDSKSGLPTVDQLYTLRALLDERALGAPVIRELLGLVGRDRAQALWRYRRWREVVGGRDKGLLHRFDGALEAITGKCDSEELPFSAQGADGLCRSPLGDVTTLIQLENPGHG